MNELVIKLDPEAVREAIERALVRGPGLMSQSPLMQALGAALNGAQDRIDAWAKEQVHTVLADTDFRATFRRAMRDAMVGEAQAMGRKAARAAVNAKEAT